VGLIVSIPDSYIVILHYLDRFKLELYSSITLASLILGFTAFFFAEFNQYT
jgi:hypothetical protein